MDVDGLITQPSRRSVREIIDRLAVELEAKGVTSEFLGVARRRHLCLAPAPDDPGYPAVT
jgi:hypothetical protein